MATPRCCPEVSAAGNSSRLRISRTIDISRRSNIDKSGTSSDASTIWLSMGTSIEDKKNDEGPQRYGVPPRLIRFFPCTNTVTAEVWCSSEAHTFLSLYEYREAGLTSSAIACRGLRSAKENQTVNRR